ncbi:hypothetical protein CO058_00885 [candidate division WWE3 bacterium CG_4_9_14_0_2_um_filter_35_11]|uniref:Uncharacterized protein n=1 Tax=candidate division WWE3 bacterium CG_4_9_14_0_2_um_filter_35_11 TaxID=1975077 RepID=A0A2M8EMJ6_UNCKA|nr:MAG: hypothetical protein COV25_00635 [candidate division WWE3 bacterium CG10_big_fil_rev_8_21_14_0_10_35_32]PJC23950.1 MAG: hypothetical protein CO058_00885 [candidate division WWE3 bacterium CG_4_9_14_0_2_um_filter_35_11]
MIKDMNPNKYLLITALLIIPFTLAYLSASFFENSSEKVYEQISKSEGLVAGASDTAVKNLTDQFPIMPGAEIVSVDTSNGNTFITLESDKSEDEIKKFYDQSSFQKNEKVEIDITENIIKVTIKS